MAHSIPLSARPRAARFALSPSQSIIAGFTAIILVGTVLLSLPAASASGRPTPLLTALFTATSATCVTGLVVVDTADHYSTFGELVILALVQIGGFGYMTSWALLALLLGWRIGLRERIVLTEAHSLYDTGGIVRFTRRIIAGALAFEALGAVILSVRFASEMPPGRAVYYGVFHSISAFNNAGFDLMGGFRSLTAYVADPVVSLTVMGLVILGGLGFTVLFDLRERRLSLHSRTVLLTTAALIGGTALLIGLLEFRNLQTLGALPWPARVLATLFQAITPRTAGFNTVPTAVLGESTLALLLVLMFIGASPGGTGGGIKTTTFIVPLAVIWSSIRGTPEPVLLGRRLPETVVYKAVTLALLAVAFIMVMSILLTLSEGTHFLPALFETTSAFGTVGLSTGLTPSLSPIGRLIVIVTIFSGRVGLLTLAFGLTRRLRQPAIRFPEGRIYVG
jgi:trk system potassium uptake protein TrkH